MGCWMKLVLAHRDWIHSVLGKPLQRSDAEQVGGAQMDACGTDFVDVGQARQRFWLTREQRCQA